MTSKSSFYSGNDTVYTDTNPPGPSDAPLVIPDGRAQSSFYGNGGQEYASVETIQANYDDMLAAEAACQASEAAAKTSETNAKTSEDNAAASESAASTSASNAAASESAAATSEANANTYKNDAQTSANAASTSAANALTSENNAASSASAAASSKTAAANSATAAANSATAASNSASQAATSATNAQNSANAAASAADTEIAAKAVRFDAAQSLTAAQKLQAQQNVALSPTDAPTFDGITSNDAVTATVNISTGTGASFQFVANNASSTGGRAGVGVQHALGGGALAIQQTSSGAAIVQNNGAADTLGFYDKEGHNVLNIIGGASPLVQVNYALASPNIIRTDVAQSLTTAQKSQGRSNLGLATVAASGAYADLSGKPTLGTAAALNSGTAVGNLVQVQTGGKLPALDGSLLTNLPSSGSGNLSNLVYDVTANGLKGDTKVVTDGAISASSTTFTSASAGFTAADVGKTIAVAGAGAAGVSLNATISVFTNSTTVTLSVAASTTVSAAEATYGTDNTSAMSALVTTVKAANGGNILFPAGWYLFSGTISLSGCANITLSGVVMAQGGNSIAKPPTRLIYTGTGSTTTFIGFTDCVGCCLKNCWVSYTNSDYSGCVVTIGNAGTRDSTYTIIEGNNFWPGTATRNTAIWLNVDKSIVTTVRNNAFWGGLRAISGAAASSYCNVCNIENNTFSSSAGTPIAGGGESWNITGNTFEGMANGSCSVFANLSTNPQAGMIWRGNWFGDTSLAATVVSVYGSGFVFTGNFCVGAAGSVLLALNAVLGGSITGNYINGYANAVNYATATCKGVVVMGNAYHVTTALESNTGNKDATCLTQANGAF